MQSGHDINLILHTVDPVHTSSITVLIIHTQNSIKLHIVIGFFMCNFAPGLINEAHYVVPKRKKKKQQCNIYSCNETEEDYMKALTDTMPAVNSTLKLHL